MTKEHDYIEDNLTTNVGLFTKEDMLRNFDLGEQEGIKSERERLEREMKIYAKKGHIQRMLINELKQQISEEKAK